MANRMHFFLVVLLTAGLLVGCAEDTDTDTTSTGDASAPALDFYGECQSKADCYLDGNAPSTSCFEFACVAAEEGEGMFVQRFRRASMLLANRTLPADAACTQCGCDGAGQCVAQAAFDGTPCGDVDGCTGSYCQQGECLAEEKTAMTGTPAPTTRV